MNISLKVDDREVRMLLSRLPKNVVVPAAVSAVNRGTQKAATEGYRAMSRTTGIRQKFLRRGKNGEWGGRISRTKIKRNPKFGAKINMASVYIRTNFPVPISRLTKGAKNRESVLRSIARRTSFITANKTFIATMPSGKHSLWYRTGVSRNIKEVSLDVDPIGTKAAQRAVKKHFYQTYSKELIRQINRKVKRL